jgi:hypothetical protein
MKLEKTQEFVCSKLLLLVMNHQTKFKWLIPTSANPRFQKFPTTMDASLPKKRTHNISLLIATTWLHPPSLYTEKSFKSLLRSVPHHHVFLHRPLKNKRVIHM